MFIRNLLLSSLLTLMSLTGLLAQTSINIHGNVTNANGGPQDSVNIIVSAFFADSTVVYHSLYTNEEGTYLVDVVIPSANLLGFVEITMVDCNGITESQSFTFLNGPFEMVADFIYCQSIPIDSCVVFILEEWNPGAIVTLTAWTTPGVDVEYAWTTGETSPTIVPQSSGTYCVTVVYPWGCVVTDCIDVNLDSNGFCFTYIVSTVNNDGSFNLEAIASGTAPFLYSWNTGAATPVITNVEPGTYCVTVIDADSCTYSSCIIVDDFNFCEVYIGEEPNGGLIAYGFGQEPIRYLWSTGDSTEFIYPVDPGLYCVTMTDGAGCSSYSCYDYGWFPDSCFVYVYAYVDSNGLALQALGYTGAQSWSYLWNTGETTETIYVQDPSLNYCVTMTDSDGCVSSACFEPANYCYAWVDLQYVDTTTAVLTVYTDPIFQWPGNITATYAWSTGDSTPVITVTESGEYCVTVTIGDDCETVTCAYVDFENLGNECSAWVIQYQDTTGQWYAEAWAWGWGTFEYLWSNGDTNAVTQISSPNDFTCVTVTSSFGCETVACLDTLYSPCEAVISINYISNTEAVLTASVWNDPNQGATFVWNTGEAGPTITVTEEGTYCVTSMAGGCVSETCIDVFFWMQDSCGVWISDDSSSGAGVEYTANAWGTAPFIYLWSNGSTEQSVFVDFGIHDLCVTITDANGCQSSGCNYPVDSCYVGIAYYNTPAGNSVQVESWDPLASVNWSTGDTLPWIEITEPGTYCATVTTIFGCVTTSCITIDSITSGEGQNVISGYVFGDTLTSLQGWVNAYFLEQNTGEAFVIADSAQIGANGFYSFNGLPDGLYLLKASLTPGTVGAEDYIPTYHLASTTWETATAHGLPNWLPVTTDIWLVRSTGMNGGGVIGGVITDPQHILAEEDLESRGLAGLEGVEVLLRDAQGQPLNYAWSLEDGSFKFTGLPWGTYRVSFDIPGIVSPDIWVTLSPENPEQLQITLVVEGGSVAVDEPTSQEITLYPNPATSEINIPVPGINSMYDVRVLDMQGKIVYAGSARNINGVLTVGVSSYAPGFYHVNLQSKENLYYGRFVKQD